MGQTLRTVLHASCCTSRPLPRVKSRPTETRPALVLSPPLSHKRTRQPSATQRNMWCKGQEGQKPRRRIRVRGAGRGSHACANTRSSALLRPPHTPLHTLLESRVVFPKLFLRGEARHNHWRHAACFWGGVWIGDRCALFYRCGHVGGRVGVRRGNHRNDGDQDGLHLYVRSAHHQLTLRSDRRGRAACEIRCELSEHSGPRARMRTANRGERRRAPCGWAASARSPTRTLRAEGHGEA